jgi:putative intracellular protease/amidase
VERSARRERLLGRRPAQLGFITSPHHAGLLESTKAIADVDLTGYDAVLLVGGQGPMYTFFRDERVHDLVRDSYEAGKITAIICHATCVLLKARLSDGQLLVNGKTWTGFANAEEDFADDYVGQKIQPFRIEDEAKALSGTNFIVAGRFWPHTIREAGSSQRRNADGLSEVSTVANSSAGERSRRGRGGGACRARFRRPVDAPVSGFPGRCLSESSHAAAHSRSRSSPCCQGERESQK